MSGCPSILETAQEVGELRWPWRFLEYFTDEMKKQGGLGGRPAVNCCPLPCLLGSQAHSSLSYAKQVTGEVSRAWSAQGSEEAGLE